MATTRLLELTEKAERRTVDHFAWRSDRILHARPRPEAQSAGASGRRKRHLEHESSTILSPMCPHHSRAESV